MMIIAMVMLEVAVVVNVAAVEVVSIFVAVGVIVIKLYC